MSEVEIGELDKEEVAILQESLRTDIPREAFSELRTRTTLEEQLARAMQVVEKVGY